MSGATVTQIVPSLPPLINGLGDHAVALAAAMQEQTGLRSRFLVSDPAWAAIDTARRDAAGLPVPAGNAEAFAHALTETVGADTVLLHYVGYAYDGRYGCPVWLLDGLARWLGAHPGARLITMFHELYASGPPWRKAFWLSGSQRRLAAALARLSDACFTSNAGYAAWIERHLPSGRHCPVWPVLSNVGEPMGLPSYEERPPALALFGRSSNRARAYQRGRDTLPALCRQLGISEIHDLGAALPDGCAPVLPGVTVHQHGILPANEVSRVLARCRVGYLDNASGRLSKSGVFAAYASHGLAPVVECRYPDEDGLVLDRHLTVVGNPPAAERFPAIATAAHAWYHGHAAPALARFVADIITRRAPQPAG